jgi:hypothetical protein
MSENVVSGEFVSPGMHEDMGVNIKMLYWMTIKLLRQSFVERRQYWTLRVTAPDDLLYS